MGADWLDSSKHDLEDGFSAAFWERHRRDLESGRFWADRIKAHHDQPADRLQIALKNLPLPGAFREAAIATRALIRAKKKRKEAWGDDLQLLYWLAAISSLSVAYSEALREPGFNIMQSIPGEVIRGLVFSYKELGYEQLPLLTPTDVKWLEESWGTPANHCTLHDLHLTVWRQHEQRLVARKEAKEREFVADLQRLLHGERSDD